MSSSATFVEIEEEGFDWQLLSIYLMGIAAIIGTLYWLKNKYFPSKKPQKEVNTTSTAAPTKGLNEIDYDWIPPHHLKNKGNPKSPRQRRRKA
jgi:hypothetical protein